MRRNALIVWSLVVVCPWPLIAAAPQVRTDTIPVVDVHVGADDERGDTFTYVAPVGWEIVDIHLAETKKGGDVQYGIASRTNRDVKVNWHVRSHTVRALGIVIDTKTAFLGLVMNVTLQKLPDPNSLSEQWPKIVAVVSGLAFLVTSLIIALFIPDPSPFQLFVFRIILASAAAGFGAALPGVLGIQVTSIPHTTIEAGGSIALFIVIYLVNPARFILSTPPSRNGKA